MTTIHNKPSLNDIRLQVESALKEDLGGDLNVSNDITASLIPEKQRATATIITRDPMVLCGVDWAVETCRAVDPSIELTSHFSDGDNVKANETLFSLKGNARALLTAERTILNFVQLLSATATTTYNYVKYLQDTDTKLLDTRKTLPGLRLAQKYAVTCGSGHNHRIGLHDAFLIKENHIAACGTIENAISQAKQLAPHKPVEVEVESLAELEAAIQANADIVMLDNFTTKQVEEAVAINNGQCKLEISGNITSERLSELARTGVDYISSGALTKNVQAIDLSMRLYLLNDVNNC